MNHRIVYTENNANVQFVHVTEVFTWKQIEKIDRDQLF